MFGTLRLILASLVVMSHVEIYPTVPGFYWFSQGAMALVGFFLLSGYLMEMIYTTKYQGRLIKAPVFWVDRWLRIFPHYYFYLIIIALWIIISKFAQLNWSAIPVISHVAVLPLNFVNLVPMQMLEGWAYWALIIPQAWTLATEFQFYLILPFLKLSKLLDKTVLLASLVVFTLASLGILPTEAYGYRLIAGTLFIFISGGLMYKLRFAKDRKKHDLIVLLFAWVYVLILSLVLQSQGKLSVPLNGPVTYGYLVLVPVVWLLSGIKQRRAWDDWLGSLSYGVFLNHYWLLWMLDWLRVFPQPTVTERWIRYGIVMTASMILAYLSYSLIDKNLRNIRLGVRKDK